MPSWRADCPWQWACTGGQARGAAERDRVFLGDDGAVAEGEFHECMNLAALWQLPVLFLCEYNLYAMAPRWIDRNPRPTSR